MPGRRLVKGDLRTGKATSTALPESIATFAFHANGSLVSARRGRVMTYQIEQDFQVMAPIPGPPTGTSQINDRKRDSSGRFWVGSISVPVGWR